MENKNQMVQLQAKVPKIPVKTTVNLAQRESHSKRTITFTAGLIAIAAVCFLVANFGVFRQLDRQRAAEDEYMRTHTLYTEMQNSLADYNEVELQYRTYSRNWMNSEDSPVYVSVNRLLVLDLAEKYLMPYGTVKNITISGDVAVFNMTDMSLEQISSMFIRLKEQKIVKGATLNIASTEKASEENLEFSITVTLGSAGEEESE